MKEIKIMSGSKYGNRTVSLPVFQRLLHEGKIKSHTIYDVMGNVMKTT